MLPKRPLASLALACGLATAASSASAALIRIDFAGSNSSPGAANVFGEPIPDLLGYLVFDDATAASSETGPNATNYAGAVRELVFTVGSGANVVFSGALSAGSYGSAQVRNEAGADRLSFNNLTLSAAQLQGEVASVVNGTAIRTFNNAQLTFGLAGSAATIGGEALAGIDPAAFTGQRNLQLFLSYTTQPGGTTAGSWPAVNFNYNLQPVTVSPVPLPATGLLLGGLLPLMALARRRRTGATG